MDSNTRLGLIIGLGVLLFFSGCAQKTPVDKCALSLCDCSCYPTGKTPEALEGKVCGINCLGEKGIFGCEYANNQCTKKYVTENDSMKIAYDFIVNAGTYRFDGSGLSLTQSATLKCPYCWLFTYQFSSSHPGYGDRSGQTISQTETAHTIEVYLEKGIVIGAVIDGKWDELHQRTAIGGPVKCTDDSDCEIAESKCADGSDPYHVCSNGTCTTLTYIADPCLTEHVCPKGRWNKISMGACFLYQSCAAAGCDDHSDTTTDECINIGTISEGCLYNVTIGNSRNGSNNTACTADSDCVPEQCCHPTTCINKDAKTPCNLLCTQVCQGPIDCGAGTCACISGKCVVKNSKYCETDADCACGTDIDTGACAVGNKKYIDAKKQCPDFCSGIAGNLNIRCVDNKCLLESVKNTSKPYNASV